MKIDKCPFCGGVGILWSVTQCESVYVVCQDCGTRTIDCKHAATAIAVWNRRAGLENKPLTLDELKQMDGEPIWVVTLEGTDEPRWEIVVFAGKRGIDLICVLNGVETRDYADFDLYNYTWLAYRNKPVKDEL